MASEQPGGIRQQRGAGVTIGAGAQVLGSGVINIDASSTADAQGQAIYSRGTTVGAAVSLMYGKTNSITELKGGSLVQSTGGAVRIHADASSTATGITRVTQNFGTSSSVNKGEIQVALAVGVIDQTAHANVDAGAKVVASGAVDLESNGTSSNNQIPLATSYVDGRAGLAAGINITRNDIQANVAGTLIAGGSGSTAVDAKLDSKLKFNPYQKRGESRHLATGHQPADQRDRWPGRPPESQPGLHR